MDWDDIKRARERLQREKGAVVKDWGGKLPVALVYPNAYYTGMSNLGMHCIYRLLNSRSDVLCERVFWEKETSMPVSVESQRPLSDFAVIAFSVSYELDYFNIPRILNTSGIPLHAADRDERHPLIIAGGPCVIANPMPLAPFFDCFGIGEAEAILPDILPVLSEGISGPRQGLLESLARIPGIYVPSVSQESVARRYARRLDDHPATSVVLTRDTELGALYLIEVERGCRWGCRFCLVSRAFRPVRTNSLETVLACATEGLRYRSQLGLAGAAVTDHPQIEEILARLRQMGAQLSISSMRIKPLSGSILQHLTAGGARTITLAPEAGSQRLRDVIKKGISEKDILETVELVARQGVPQVKLYFMVGLPTETDRDIEEIIDLALRCKRTLGRSGTRITINVSPFVPKAGTPFQWLPMAPLHALDERISLLKRRLTPEGVRIKEESPAWSEVQAVLSRGDARLAEVLASAAAVSLAGWREAVEKCHLDAHHYSHQAWDAGQELPWDMLLAEGEKRLLAAEMDKALDYAGDGASLASNRR